MISIQYFGILIIAVLVYWLIPKQYLRNVLLIISSFAFIYLMDKWSLVVVIILTLVSYAFGTIIYRYPKKNWIHVLGVVVVLVSLIAFKYLGFLGRIFNSLSEFMAILPRFEIRKLLLPLGISYIVFKHISYLTDIKWGLVKPGRFIDFLLYSSLYTIFVAGPIERFERFKPQIETLINRIEWIDIDYAIFRILAGIVKKLVIADWLAFIINPIQIDPLNYPIWVRGVALIGYSFHIYFDFSGYSDVAIGSSRLFGLKIMENFNNPYLASNISQFWRRWHISLSDWIRDYLFFPLARISRTRIWLMFCVPVIAMALCGFWHGSAWNFILWGIWHGVGISVLQFWSYFKRRYQMFQGLTGFKFYRYASIFMSYLYVTLGWGLFYLPIDKISSYYLPHSSLASELSTVSLPGLLLIVSTSLIVFLATPLSIHLMKMYNFTFYAPENTNKRWILIVCMIWLIVFAAKSNGQSFIYLRF